MLYISGLKNKAPFLSNIQPNPKKNETATPMSKFLNGIFLCIPPALPTSTRAVRINKTPKAFSGVILSEYKNNDPRKATTRLTLEMTEITDASKSEEDKNRHLSKSA